MKYNTKISDDGTSTRRGPDREGRLGWKRPAENYGENLSGAARGDKRRRRPALWA